MFSSTWPEQDPYHVVSFRRNGTVAIGKATLPANFLWRSMYAMERVTAGRQSGPLPRPPKPLDETLDDLPAGACVQEFLESEGISEGEFAVALSGAPPNWRARLGGWSSLLASVLAPCYLRSKKPAAPSRHDPLARSILYPFGAWARACLDRARPGLSNADEVMDWSTVRESAVEELEVHLAGLMRRPLALAVNLARIRGHSRGMSGEERFRKFVDALVQDVQKTRRFYLRYPVLARLFAETCLNWRAATLSGLSAFCERRGDIVAAVLGGKDPGRLKALQPTGGDLHNGGRRVLLFRCESGTAVYKPRSLRVDVAFQELLGWFNALGPRHRLPTVRVLPGRDHGWMEFVEAAPVADESAVKRFYWRQGAHVAILHMLGGTDFHAENLVARGEDPVLVDLEALFRAPLTAPPGPTTPADRFMRESVLSTGLLPLFRAGDPAAQVPEYSGVGLPDGQIWHAEQEVPEALGTDEVRYVRKKVTAHTAKNRPVIDGKNIDFGRFQDDIREGFEESSSLLLGHRKTLLSDGGPLLAFRDAEVRQVLRGTMVYSRIMRRAQHPDFLGDALDAELVLSSVARRPLSVARALGSELRAMRRGEVPFFSNRPRGTELWGEGQTFAAAGTRPAYEIIRQQLAELTDADVERQRLLVHLSLFAASPEHGTPRRRSTPASPEELLSAAPRALGEVLCKEAIREGEAADWLAFHQNAYGYSALRPAGLDVFHGVAGIGIALAYLARECRSERFFDCACAALALARRFVHMPEGVGGGAFGGQLSAVYGLLHGALALDRPDFREDVEKVLDDLRGTAHKDHAFDIITGAAGAIGVLLAVHQTLASRRALELAVEFGERLLASRVVQESGWGWSSGVSRHPLTGFSHGAAGIGWALLKLAAATGAARFREAGQMAFEYERAQFMPSFGNWADLREPLEGATSNAVASPTGAMAWCHGAPGIALSRATVPSNVICDADRQDAEVGIAKILSGPAVSYDCLCHGELGNLEIVHVASYALERPEWRGHVQQRLSELAGRRLARGRWACGIGIDEETPSLMLGTAGIALALLRMKSPDRVPSVLAIEPPPGNGVV